MAIGGKKKKAAVWGATAAAAVTLALFLALKGKASAPENMPLHEVASGPLTISVSSSGSVQSRDKVDIISELEGNNTIIWVIEEGTKVEAGELLLEFDASTLIEKRKEQEVDVANKESALLIAQENLEITRGEREAMLQDAEIDLKLSEMDLQKYQEGDHPQQLRQFESDIALANEELQRAEEKLTWSQKLSKEGYLTRTELQADQIAAQRAAITLAMANTKMNVYTNFTVYKDTARYESDLRRNDRKFKRTQWQNKATIRQIESEVAAKLRDYTRSTNRLAELDFQIEKSRVLAPTNGIVLYASSVQISRRQWWAQPLRAGGTANQRQELIYIPLESGMIVEVMIPEASLNKLRQGMHVNIKIDALPGKVFSGKLVKIGLLPDGQSANLSPDVKLYKCEIEFAANDPVIRSGMSCDVELVREVYDNAVFVPIQCVVREGEAHCVYLPEPDGKPVPRAVEVGLDNNRMIRILSGLTPGEKVLLAPPIKDTAKQKDEKEKDPAADRPKKRSAAPGGGGKPREP